MTAIVDYGVGNLFSLNSSLAAIGEEAAVTRDAGEIAAAQRVILPGVGAFADARRKLSESGLEGAVLSAAESGKPLLGICLGMQLLFERSYEYGEHAGLGLLRGVVAPLAGRIPAELPIPHMGWNALSIVRPGGILKYVSQGECVYFVHSYAAWGCEDSLCATAEYGAPVTAAVQRGNIYGCQFHPEKSSRAGLAILRAFCELGGGPC